MFWLAGDVKEPTRFSQRVGHEVPGVVVWPLLLKWGSGWELLGDISYHKATLQSEGKHSIQYSEQIAPSWGQIAAQIHLSCRGLSRGCCYVAWSYGASYETLLQIFHRYSKKYVLQGIRTRALFCSCMLWANAWKRWVFQGRKQDFNFATWMNNKVCLC